MDRIEKALRKLVESERKIVKAVLERLSRGDIKNLDVKKLKDHENIFRVRKGNIRIIYRLEESQIFILVIEHRGKDTYKKL